MTELGSAEAVPVPFPPKGGGERGNGCTGRYRGTLGNAGGTGNAHDSTASESGYGRCSLCGVSTDT